MSNVIGALTGASGQKKALEAQIAQQQSQATSQQGQQLRLLSQQQALNDNSTAQVNRPGLGRAMLAYQRNGGPGTTLGN
ncbi:MAG: hypothetical protein KGQ37_03755 [Hyphomicrobiales bacterium]|nr:hypothetical protein [Hyphomicrobiales bacterium]